MSRRERPLDPDEGTLSQFAAGLRELRRTAGSPAYRELGRLAHYSAGTLSDAAGGRKLPTLAVTLAYVQACGGDTAVWERRWRELDVQTTASRADDVQPPYAGLAPFQPEDADRFFGRDALVQELVELVAKHRLVAVFGPSGVGKSSVLRAGLIPELDSCVLFTPGARPMAEYSARVSAETEFVVVDQFEEVFTLCADAGERTRFIETLLDADARVVLGIRADFYAHCAVHPALAKALCDAQLLVGPMQTAELQAAITKPAVQAGYVVEGALVAELVAQSAGQAGLLPMVSHVLRETWYRRQGTMLTVAGYHAAGGIQGALAKTADEVYESFDDEQKVLVRQLFLRLTALGEGTEDTKRRITRAEFDGVPIDTVLVALAEARLITVDATTIEMAHESLIRAWPRLRGWLTEDRDGLRIHRQLTEAALAWESLGRDPGSLYRGTRLQLAGDWPGNEELAGREREFLDASRQADRTERGTIRRRARRFRQLSAVLAVLLVIAMVAVILAVRAQNQATDQRNVAISQNIASQSEAMRTVNPALAAQLSLAAYRLAPTVEARSSLLSSFASPYATKLTGHTEGVNSGAWSPDGHTVATASDDHTVILWDYTNPYQPRRLSTLPVESGEVYSVTFRGDGRVAATADFNHLVKLWDVKDLTRPRLLSVAEGHQGRVFSVAFSRDGRLMATSSEDATAKLWDVSDPASPHELSTLRGHTERIYQVAFRPGDDVLATASMDGTTRLWDIAVRTDPRPLPSLAGHTDRVRSVAFDSTGHIAVTASFDRTVRLWDLTDVRNPRPLSVLNGHKDHVNWAALSPDGHTVTSVGDDRTVRLWDVTNPADPHEIRTLTGHTEKIWFAAFSPDGRTLLTTSWDRTARLWELADPTNPAPLGTLAGHTEAVYSVVFSPDGHTAATGGQDNTVRLWEVTDPQRPTLLSTIAASSAAIRTVAFSLDGHTLAAGGDDRTTTLWDITDRERPRPLRQLTGQTDIVYSVAFGPDGRTLAAANNDKSVLLADLSDPGTPQALAAQSYQLYAVAFGPGGLMATAGFDSAVRLWDIKDRDHPHLVGTLAGHTGYAKAIAFGPGGHTLATVGSDAMIWLWDLTDPAKPTLLSRTRDAGPVSTVAYSADGRLLATASDDHTARLWDVHDPRNPTAFATLTGHANVVGSVAFGPDGHTLATASEDHFVILRETDVERVAARVCATAYPRITQAEWDQYLPGIAYRPPC